MRELEPDRKPTGPFVQALPVESVTVLTETDPPALTAIAATSAWPAVAVIGTVRVVPLVLEPVACRTG